MSKKQQPMAQHHYILAAAVLIIASTLFFIDAPATVMGGKRAPGPSPTNPVISNIQVTQVTRTSATISYTTDVPASVMVNYGLKASALNSGAGGSNPIVLDNLKPATKYYFVLSASGSAGGFSKSTNQSFTTQAYSTTDITPPVPPTLTAVALPGAQNTLTWSGATDASGINRYSVYRDGVEAAALPADGATWTDIYARPNTAVSYQVRVWDNVELTSISARVDINTSSATAPADTTKPSTPTNFSGVGISSDKISLSWTASTDNVGVTQYRIFRSQVAIGTATQTSFVDSGLQPGNAYNYMIIARDAAGNESPISTQIIVSTQQGGTSTTTATTTP